MVALWPFLIWRGFAAGLDIQRATLQRATLQRGVLQRATLQRVTLQRATLQRGTLQRATLQRGTLQRGVLDGMKACGMGMRCSEGFYGCSVAIFDLA